MEFLNAEPPLLCSIFSTLILSAVPTGVRPAFSEVAMAM
jgi:hypothetical protein